MDDPLPTPEEVHAYLAARDWTVRDSTDERGDGFRLYEHPHPGLPGTGVGIWIPQRRAAADYRRRLFEALSTVGEIERRLSVPEQVARACTARPPTTPVGDGSAQAMDHLVASAFDAASPEDRETLRSSFVDCLGTVTWMLARVLEKHGAPNFLTSTMQTPDGLFELTIRHCLGMTPEQKIKAQEKTIERLTTMSEDR